HYRDKILPTLLATWAVWIPLMAIIYSLPLALQFPLFGLALTFWVLLLTYMTNRFAGKIEADAPLALAVAGDVEASNRSCLKNGRILFVGSNPSTLYESRFVKCSNASCTPAPCSCCAP